MPVARRGAVDPEPPGRPAPKQWTSPRLVGEEGFNPATSQRVPDRATARTDDFQNADGSMTRRVYSVAQNYRDADGVYRPIDLNLVSRAGRLQTGAHSIQVSVADRGTEDRELNQSLGSVNLPSGPAVAFGLSGAATVPAIVAGPTATYMGILPETDIELAAYPDGLKRPSS